MLIDCSLIITHQNKKNHLENLLNKLAYIVNVPKEVIIVSYGEKYTLTSTYDFEIKQCALPLNENTRNNKGVARNKGAEIASYENLFFLDVYCLPSSDFFLKMTAYLDDCKGLLMATPKYLQLSSLSHLSDEYLRNESSFDPECPEVNDLQHTSNSKFMKDFCLGIKKSTFIQLGGFKEVYSDYEKTGFKQQHEAESLPFFLCDAITFQQRQQVLYARA